MNPPPKATSGCGGGQMTPGGGGKGHGTPPSGEDAAAAGRSAAKPDGSNAAGAGATSTLSSSSAPSSEPTSAEPSSAAVAAPSPFSSLGPGAFRVAGPGFEGTAADLLADGENTSNVANASGSAATDGALVADGEAVFEGYVPDPTPEEAEEARIKAEVEEMKRRAVTLDASAVRTIDNADSPGGDEPAPSGKGGGIRKCLKRPLAAVALTAAVLLAIALGVAFGSGGGDGSEEEGNGASQPSCTIESVRERYDVARSIVSEITATDVLDDAASPQAQALEWLVCKDQLSSDLIDSRDLSTGVLPTQPHGTIAGDAGESQVLRRYILVAFVFATSADGPWGETLNFLSGDRHECAWHENKTRFNFPYGDFDPVGLVCNHENDGPIVLNDDEEAIGRMDFNMRVSNNLTGTLPLELGHLADLGAFNLESHKGLRGSLPSTLGNLASLNSFSVLFVGPELGGMIPPSLITLPQLQYISISFNEGQWQLPSNIDMVDESRLANIQLWSTGLSGALPPFISELKRLQFLDLAGNSLEGSLPDSIGDLPYLDYLNLHGSKLDGTLPESLGRLQNITALVLGENRFQGTLPESLGNLPKLRLLDLGHNELEGTVPASFSGLTSLEHISLQNNANLYGPISVFESLGNLTTLALSRNNFSSTIPEGLRLIRADFGRNNFVGDLPEAFVDHASNTSYLSLMQNNLDADVVEDVICEEVPVLFADCKSCTCCQDSCCDEDSTDPNDPYCHYEFDFNWAVGLECGLWWDGCAKVTYDVLPVE